MDVHKLFEIILRLLHTVHDFSNKCFKIVQDD